MRYNLLTTPVTVINFLLSLALSMLSVVAEAQTLSNEGIEGFVDAKHRGPVLTVGPSYFASGSNEARSAGGAYGLLLVDASVPNTDYKEYPIRFEFYVNRQLVSTQLRSEALPGPIGLSIPTSMATVPFNYSVVATVLYPNRSFSTVINGAITTGELSISAK